MKTQTSRSQPVKADSGRLSAFGRSSMPGAAAWFAQSWLLMKRCWDAKKSDRSSLLISGLQVPLIAVLLIMAFYGGDPSSGALLFCLTVSALWFGVFSSVREVVSEYGIYRRERRLGMKVTAYVASKLPVLFSISTIQVAILLAMVYPVLLADYETAGIDNAVRAGWMFVILLLTAIGGVGLGLMLSALALILGQNTANRAGIISSEVAMSLVPVALLPQIVLGGPFFLYGKAFLLTRILSKLMLARWSLSASLSLEGDGPQTLARQLGMRGETAAMSCLVMFCLCLAHLVAAMALIQRAEEKS